MGEVASGALDIVTRAHSRPFLANSIFLAASPSFQPPLLTQIMLPSPSSNLSSRAGKGHGQWCGKWTQDRVLGHRYLSQRAVRRLYQLRYEQRCMKSSRALPASYCAWYQFESLPAFCGCCCWCCWPPKNSWKLNCAAAGRTSKRMV